MTAIKDSSKELWVPTIQNLAACDCGWKQMATILGGQETGVNEFPSMAGLVNLNPFIIICGASIISEFFVLTAGHCVYNRDRSTFSVLVGGHNITSGTTPYSKIYNVNTYEIFPNFSLINTVIADIAIIQTQNQIVFSLYIGPICLPLRYKTSDFVGQLVTALGWGSLNVSDSQSDVLRKTSLTVISNQQCARDQTENINNNHICTFTLRHRECAGDSGGPLLWMDPSTQRLHLIGIISHGLDCNIDSPSINTRVTSYLDWIVARTGVNFCTR
ncbi:venom serine protease 34-like [Cylas formicarius]|uniref:venom serine protease 34-like n=1 Tax=Cylas formicarius TaxID=197179 RepID=UPI0029589DD9|nr:venom serine protease 34-like [Cylas formicarius]